MERVFVWTGGALFVGSLATCVSWYLMVLGRPTHPANWSAAAADAALVTIFALHHSAFARDAVKQRLVRFAPRVLRSTYVWTASILLIGVCLFWRTIGGALYDLSGPAGWTLALVQIVGVSIIASAVARIDPLELAGIREPRGGERLQVGGPFRWVRHPLYLGWVLAVFGAAHLTGDRLAFAVLTTAYLVVAMPWEERSLRRSFGAEYERYVERVRWRIVPFIY